jgi:hypothetical protein
MCKHKFCSGSSSTKVSNVPCVKEKLPTSTMDRLENLANVAKNVLSHEKLDEVDDLTILATMFHKNKGT